MQGNQQGVHLLQDGFLKSKHFNILNNEHILTLRSNVMHAKSRNTFLKYIILLLNIKPFLFFKKVREAALRIRDVYGLTRNPDPDF
jgi:hypothetical protein